MYVLLPPFDDVAEFVTGFGELGHTAIHWSTDSEETGLGEETSGEAREGGHKKEGGRAEGQGRRGEVRMLSLKWRTSLT